MSNDAGVLYVVATPIGNLADLGARAADVLRLADVVAAEDTRHSRRLFEHIGARARMISLHEHNERQRSAGLVATLQSGQSIALICDAGTPLVSDPGFRLVRAARQASIRVVAVPGPCAAVAALSIAGLPSDRFAFEGFLPPRAGARRRCLEALATEPRTMIFYVSPRRLVAVLRDAAVVFGADREAGLARELTKVYESYYPGTLGELAALAERDAHVSRGELVLLVGGAGTASKAGEADKLLAVLLETLPLKTAVDIAARVSGEARNRVYRRALEVQRGIAPASPQKRD